MSMATPLTAGATNLVYEYLVRGFYPLGNLYIIYIGEEVYANRIANPKASLMKAMVIHSAVKMKGFFVYDGKNETRIEDETWPSFIQGFGLVSLNK